MQGNVVKEVTVSADAVAFDISFDAVNTTLNSNQVVRAYFYDKKGGIKLADLIINGWGKGVHAVRAKDDGGWRCLAGDQSITNKPEEACEYNPVLDGITKTVRIVVGRDDGEVLVGGASLGTFQFAYMDLAKYVAITVDDTSVMKLTNFKLEEELEEPPGNVPDDPEPPRGWSTLTVVLLVAAATGLAFLVARMTAAGSGKSKDSKAKPSDSDPLGGIDAGLGADAGGDVSDAGLAFV